MHRNFQHWDLKIDNHIAWLTFDRPNEKNRIDSVTLTELSEITKVLNSQADVWVVILQANGPAFSSGVDISLIGEMIGQDRKTYAENLKNSQTVLDEFEKIQKPTIAAIHGYCIGGGIILSLCCDFRIAADDAIFALPEVKRSIGVIMGTQRITRVIGVAATKELVMLGNPIKADRALQIGLVKEVVLRKDLKDRALTFAQQFLALPPLAVGLCKKIIDEGQFLERSGQDLEIEAQAALLDTEDFKEAITSFFEKRQPNFKGK